MSEEMKQALLEVALQLEEQLKFYNEFGLTDIGDSRRDERFSVASTMPARPEEIAPHIEPAEANLTSQLHDEPYPTQELPVAKTTISASLSEESVMPKKEEAEGQDSFPQSGLFGEISRPSNPNGLPILEGLPQDASLEEIRADIGDCTRCKLHVHRTRIVFGEGNPQAELMFVGEGPGADEDATGRPFVGRAGQLLDKIIAAIGRKREDVFIANVVKCRPPQNRTPEKDETDTCEPFLFRQIALIKPKVIVALGSPAFQCLFRTKEAISRARGQFRDWNGIQVMPTFHPAYLLRSPDKKREAWEDMKKVRDYLTTLGR
jgi:uracil-DNA glycosylase